MADDDVNNVDDLEDGEIESDEEQIPAEPQPIIEIRENPPTEQKPEEKQKDDSKKSDSKSKKSKEKHKKPEERKSSFEKSKETISTEDDFAGNIEKAIRKELKKRVHGENGDNDDPDGKRKHKKRKKEHTEKEAPPKKKKKDNAEEDVDDDELMCIRGASPIRRRRPSRESAHSDGYNSAQSDGSERDYRDRRRFRMRGGMRDFHGSDRMRRFDRHKVDQDGVCLFYLQGKCYKGDDCVYSHEGRPKRKMELCKFYLMDCCAKKDKCLYLHSDFPCKFYHTGLKCNADNCKFSHGKPLSDNFKMILLKHIESAPKEILGDFPRLTREQSASMVINAQNRLKQQFGIKIEDQDKNTNEENEKTLKAEENSPQGTEKPKKSRLRPSRWRDSPVVNPVKKSSGLSPADAQNILSIQNLNGVLNSQQISDLSNMGIENLNQLSQLTVIQLNQLGITISQINEIQLNTISIQKLGLIDANASSNPAPFFNKPKVSTDFDMRVPPMAVEAVPEKKPDLKGQDVDMRFLSHSNDNNTTDSSNSADPRKKSTIDIDQYTKDALKFVEKETEVKIENGQDGVILDVDHRVLNYVRDATIAKVKLDDDTLNKPETDSDIRLTSLPVKQQEMYMRIQQKNEQRTRRPTTDDEEDNLQIDEKWYSSDEETEKNETKEKSPPPSEKPPEPQIIEPNTVLKNLGDLSKIDISAEVTKLLTSIKSSTNMDPKPEPFKSRDPRSLAKLLSENKEEKKKEFVSIYECDESNDIPKLDTDLRPTKDLDFRLPTFGDTDLRQTPGSSDIDLRLALPLKPMPNHTPAKEIDGSINSHPHISYKVSLVDIPKTDYTDIKNSIPRSRAAGDPRLRIIFRISLDETPSDTEKPKAAVRSDPRKRQAETIEKPVDKILPQTCVPLDLQVVIQMSDWYKDLSSNNKILVNQQLATVTSNLKKFHQDKTPNKKFDLSDIKSNNVLCMIFGNLGIFLDEKGEYFPINSQDNASINPSNFNTGPDMFMAMQDNTMVNSMPPINNFDPRYNMGDPRGAPGILGMPPNIPPNFDNMNYGNNGNYNSDNYNSYDDDGYGHNGDDYMNDNSMDDDYYQDQNDYQNQNNYRGGRNNDRWNHNNRNQRGNRDRRGYNDRSGGWKNDRR